MTDTNNNNSSNKTTPCDSFEIQTGYSREIYKDILGIIANFYGLMNFLGLPENTAQRSMFECNPTPYLTTMGWERIENETIKDAIERAKENGDLKYEKVGMKIPQEATVLLDPNATYPIIYLKDIEKSIGTVYGDGYCNRVVPPSPENKDGIRLPNVLDKDNIFVIKEQSLETNVIYMEKKKDIKKENAEDDKRGLQEGFISPWYSEFVKLSKKNNWDNKSYEVNAIIKNRKLSEFRTIIVIPYFIASTDILGVVSFKNEKGKDVKEIILTST